MKKKDLNIFIPVEFIERKIYLVRGQKIIFDYDIAKLYQVETRALVQAVRRNRARFPNDFMFQISKEELKNWRSQIVISNPRAKMSLRYPPYVFTEQGVAMLSSVLRSHRAIQVNIAIMRVFVRIRELMISNKDLARRLDDLENKYNSQFKVVFDAIRQLLTPAENPNKTEIGFKPRK